MAADQRWPVNTHEIEPARWPAELDQFSRMHRGQRVRVRTGGGEFGVQCNASNMPLLGVTAERRGPTSYEIQVMVGESPDILVTHVISRPRQVWLADWNDAVSAALHVQAEDGTRTLVEAGPAKQTLPPGYIVDDIQRATEA